MNDLLKAFSIFLLFQFKIVQSQIIINANKNFNLKSSSKAFDHTELSVTTRILLEIFQIMVFVIFSIHTLFFSLRSAKIITSNRNK